MSFCGVVSSLFSFTAFWVIFGKIAIPLISGVTGGWIGASATKNATRESLRHHEELAKQSEAKRITSFCLALSSELEAVWDRYMKSVGDQIVKLEKGQYLKSPYIATYGYLMVYDSGAGLLGNIDNNELRTEIIKTYTDIKGLLDTFKTHNGILENRAEFQQLIKDQSAETLLAKYAQILKDSQTKLDGSIRRTRDLIADYAKLNRV